MIYTIFTIWNYLFLVGFLLLFFRTDSKLILNDILGMFITPNILALFVSFVMIYFFIPITIPYSIKNITKND